MPKRKFLLTFESRVSDPKISGIIVLQKTEIKVSGTGHPTQGIIEKGRELIMDGFKASGLRVHGTQLINSLEIATGDMDDFKIVL